MMNDKKLERIAKAITALLFVVSVTMFVMCFLVQPSLLESPTMNAPVSPVEAVEPEINTLVMTYSPKAIEEMEIVKRTPEPIEEVEEIVVEPEIVEQVVIETEEVIEVTEDLVEIEPVAIEEVVEVDAVDIVDDFAAPSDGYFDIPLGEELQNHMFTVCDEYGVDPALIIAVIEKESGFIEDAVGDYGRSLGLMQIQPQWFQVQMAEHGFDNLLDPYQNIVIGVEYLAELFAMGRGDAWALMAYNGGPAYANSMGDYVSDYAATVMDKWAAYRTEMEW